MVMINHQVLLDTTNKCIYGLGVGKLDSFRDVQQFPIPGVGGAELRSNI
jgi:hypothetical protein